LLVARPVPTLRGGLPELSAIRTTRLSTPLQLPMRGVDAWGGISFYMGMIEEL
jgi:hypothetical protein